MAGTFYKQFIRVNYIFGLALMITFVPHSKIMVSIAQIWLAGTFAMDRYNTRKWIEFFQTNPLWKKIAWAIPVSVYHFLISIVKGFRSFFHNPLAMIFSSILLMHFIGLIYTTDFDYAFKDIRTKLPLFLLPLFISTSPAFNRRYFYGFMLLYAASVLVRTLINTWNLFEGHFVDIRDISRSISHVVLALHVSMTMFVLVWFIFKQRTFSIGWKIMFGVVTAWLLAYLILARSTTGLVITSLTLLIMIIIFIIRSKRVWLKICLASLLIISGGLTVVYVSQIMKDYYNVTPVNFSKLEKVSPRGHPYLHDTISRQTENGNYLYIYIQVDELRDAWNKRSSIPFNGRDKKNQLIINTLVRYLTSRGLKKDADGMNRLSNDEIRAIEKGIANVIFTRKFSISGQIYELLWGLDEYRKSGDPTGSSQMQRLEFWKASLGIIKEHWLTGVGTGDMNEAFQQQYEKMKTKLAPDQRWRSHDQYLSILVGFGIFGFLWFLFAILYPAIALGKFKDYFFLVFFIIAMLSMITEDTIESQLAVTFFAFFYSFFLFARQEDDKI
jgi:hypothetical protein